ncbi:adenylyl-sulfate kinase [Kineosporia sp. A_224]|uniref:adenylyl-sulfate kinase n=1 Tax=Kineosporia sp. A_224 TaxID=1962180 RepID=UPI00117BB466|nr:adenylyl-sulfate kinase [Kineosporia sp. A_224]
MADPAPATYAAATTVAPDRSERPDRPDGGGTVRWHPPRAVLELAELVVTGALPALPPEALLALEDAAPDDVRAVLREGWTVELEDAEGTPVARVVRDGTVGPLQPFAHGPLRSRRRTPEQVRAALDAQGADDVAAVLVAAPLTAEVVDRVVRGAVDAGRTLLWCAVVGAGPAAALAPPALLRATTRLAELTRAAGGRAEVLVLALPREADGLPQAALARRVARAYGAGAVADVAARPADGIAEHPAFAAERALRSRAHGYRGVTVFFTGLSGSGKSTVAKALAERLLDDGRREVTMLDGDEVRRLLSHGLGFGRADRDLNIRRIGYVAAEVSRHGGLAVAAPIAPFDAVRKEVRALVEDAGADFVLVHVATPLEECERRDRKGLYAKARRGEVADFTGISSPYEAPADADLVVDTTGRAVEDVVDAVWALLAAGGHLDGPRDEQGAQGYGPGPDVP